MRALLLLLVGCGEPGPFLLADVVVDAPGATDDRFGDPELAVNGVRGGGDVAGSLDVYALGAEGAAATLVLGFSDLPAPDQPGPDLAVFENPFLAPTTGAFMDLVVVSVRAEDGDWVTFPHDYLAEDETRYDNDPALWSGFAGRTPVQLHEEDNAVDPFSVEAGGDVFDLSDLPDTPEADDIRTFGFVEVRLESAISRVNPDTGAPYVMDPISNGADIDGVYAWRSP